MEDRTVESHLVWEIDKLEMAIQALEYSEKGYDIVQLREFWVSAASNIKDKDLLRFMKIFKI